MMTNEISIANYNLSKLHLNITTCSLTKFKKTKLIELFYLIKPRPYIVFIATSSTLLQQIINSQFLIFYTNSKII